METQKIAFDRQIQSEIILGTDILKDIAVRLTRLRMAKKCVIVTNDTVAKWYLQPLIAELRTRGMEAAEIIIPDGEKHKSLSTAESVISRLSELNTDRDCPIIALGGGVITDLTGFIASIYKRGIPLVLMPTSLLAMVDAAVGGKNAVNTDQGKNLIGTFYQPLLTAIDVSYLKTLPLSQLAYGLVEAIKHGAIADAAYFRFIAKNLEDIKAKQLNILQRLIRRSIHIKRSFVAEDEFDQGLRAHLNFGHTFAHALEVSGNFIRLHHGEAVGIGMLMALKASANVGLLKEDYRESLKVMLNELGLPDRFPSELEKKEIINCIFQDKKKNQTGFRFILPVTLGKTEIFTLNEDKLQDFVLASI